MYEKVLVPIVHADGSMASHWREVMDILLVLDAARAVRHVACSVLVVRH